ncbi:hypothetical protein, partial [Salmonella sp. SAL4444]|uniref:hypothetical protein n=1 Tax=Salmonella sp. SAL4444 TaxID=3159899 RepID=UPI00397C1C97
LDLTERFSDIVKDVNADPWELKTTGVGEDGLMIFTLSGLTGVPTLETDVEYSGFTALPGVAGAAGAVGLAFPLILPVGARLTMV